MGQHRSAPLRVFLSHTDELPLLPLSRSFVSAAESAIARAGHAVSDMAYFAARDSSSAQICRDAVEASDVYVLIAGFRYGSLVRDHPEVSYTEFEYATASEFGMPCLVFLLDDKAEGPPSLFLDREFGSRQEIFREHLLAANRVITKVSTPDSLETQLLHTLIGLREVRIATTRGHAAWNVPAQLIGFVGRDKVLIDVNAKLNQDAPKLPQVLVGMGGIGKSSLVVEYAHRYSEVYDAVWWVRAEKPELIAGQLAELSHVLGLASRGDDAKIAVARLFGELRRSSRSLIVYDNAEASADLVNHLPGGACHVNIQL